jgi:uncharacterized membrane protein
MRTTSHVVLILGGALIGLAVGHASYALFAALMGAAAGLAIAETGLLWRRVQDLHDELQALRSEFRARREPVVPPEATASMAPVPETAVPEAAAPEAATPVLRPAPIPVIAAPAPPEPVADVPLASTPRVAYESPELPVVRVIREFLTGGNTLVRGGVVILFFGIAFLLRYVAEHAHVPIEFRLAGVALGAVALLVLGWRLRLRRAGYALALQGGAVGILYLTVFAALRLYGLLSPAVAFPLLVLLAALSAILAVLQNSQAFALLAVTGGFLAPILASTGQGSHVVLFSYYAILNAAILGTAWFKAWRPLNLAGFLFTFAIGTAWGVLRYRPEFFASTEPFLVLFFLFYVAIAVLYSLRQAPELRGYIDATLIFGTPLAAFGLQAALLHGQLMRLAYSAVLVSALYLGIAWTLQQRRNSEQRLLIEAFLALGTVFLTLAVPLALNGQWSAATWALEGAALVWVGCRQRRALARAFGTLLQFLAGAAIWWHSNVEPGNLALPAGMYLSGMLVGVASVYASYLLHSRRESLQEYERNYAIPLFIWGVLWWSFSGAGELQQRVADDYLVGAELCFAAATALLCSELVRQLRFAPARVPALLLLPVMVLFLLYSAIALHHPFEHGGWWFWPLAIAGLVAVVRRHEGAPGTALASALQSGSLWLVIALVSWEMAWQVQSSVGARGSWSGISWAVVPAAVLFLLPMLTERVEWPFAAHRRAYLALAGPGIALYLAAWILLVNLLMSGDSYPLPYVPLLNPLDVALGFAVLVLTHHYLVWRGAGLAGDAASQPFEVGVLAALAFVCLNGALFRALHHWAGVPFTLDSMLASTLAQTSLSVFWTLLALATMLFATRRGVRVVWLCGAGLLGAVVIKLFLVDLSSIGSIERIVSFVAVGLLMLVIGYFSPLPPAIREGKS